MINKIPYTEGWNSAHVAYTGGNPYRIGSPQHSDWRQGRSDGQAALGIKPVDWAALRAQQEGGE
jgi:hypothetical protein